MDGLLQDWQGQLWILGRVAVAMLLGGLVGLEREMMNKPAGFRTHMLVAGAAALLVSMGDALLDTFDSEGHDLRPDPIRIVEAIVAGVSFLGAGTIFRREGKAVEGLTTAASILLCAAIGIGVALRLYVLAVSVTVLSLVVLGGLRWLEQRVHGVAVD